MVKSNLLIVALAAGAIGGAGLYVHARTPQPQSVERANQTYKVARRDFVRGVRLTGTVEAVQATTIFVPRLAGQNQNSLVVTALVKAGQTVHPGDLLVEFDRQDQMRNALDKQAELNDLEQQIRKRRAQEAAARAADDSTMKQAETTLQRAKLEMLKNEMLPKIQAEKNALALEEAEARLKQLQATYELKRLAAEADVRVLEIRWTAPTPPCGRLRRMPTGCSSGPRSTASPSSSRRGKAGAWPRSRKGMKCVPAFRSSTWSTPRSCACARE